MMVEVNASLVFEFRSKQHWANKAQSEIGHYRNTGITIICIDRLGNQCQIGEDFRLADENNLYPVKVYELVRVKHYLFNAKNIGDDMPQDYYKDVTAWVDNQKGEAQP